MLVAVPFWDSSHRHDSFTASALSDGSVSDIVLLSSMILYTNREDANVVDKNEIENSASDSTASADRRTFLKAAGLGAGAVAGTAYGKFGLAPITTAEAATGMPKLTDQKWWPSNGALTIRQVRR